MNWLVRFFWDYEMQSPEEQINDGPLIPKFPLDPAGARIAAEDS